MEVFKLRHCLDDDFPMINWDRHAPMADLWLEIEERHKAGQEYANLLSQISYRLRLTRRWTPVDCIEMVPGLGVSVRARVALESLGIPGMRFLEFRVNHEPFFLFFTERRIDCLDRKKSIIKYFSHAPDRIKHVTSYAFIEEQICSSDVFTVPELSDGMFFWSQETFVTGSARVGIERAGLVGFRFERLSK